jgi:hypothetical protein
MCLKMIDLSFDSNYITEIIKNNNITKKKPDIAMKVASNTHNAFFCIR